MPADPPAENPGTAPIDLATLAPESPPGDTKAPTPDADEPIGGPATTAATAWTGASDEELDAEPAAE